MQDNSRRIIIVGKTASDVQGVTLRDGIQRAAKGIGIRGFVKNMKGEPRSFAHIFQKLVEFVSIQRIL